MYTELQKARLYYDLHCKEENEGSRDMLWQLMWEALMKQYNRDTRKVCYVCDLLFQSHCLREYGQNTSKETDYKHHLLRGLDEYHW